jgi:cytochrome c peroxidase
MKRISILVVLSSLFLLCCKRSSTEEEETFYYNSEAEFIANNSGLSDTALIGKLIFFDQNLSEPAGISCATCHSPMSGFSDSRHTSFSAGVGGLLGTRNASAISYMVFAPNRRAELVRGVWEMVGGFFWDGKAEFLNQQALFPLIHPHEMNNPGFGAVSQKIKNAAYYPKLEKLFGSAVLADSQTIVLYSVLCLQKFQQSRQVNTFTSKFDFYLKGKAALTDPEKRGMVLFNDTTKSKCSLCHLTTPTSYATTSKIVFTDYSYDNIGLPKHPDQLGMPVDSGLAIFERNEPLEVGRFKAPTLRNIAITAPYMHNGIFNTLEEVMEFYNERDVNPAFVPEYAPTMNTNELGNLNLSQSEINDIIAFLKTLTDGYKIP